MKYLRAALGGLAVVAAGMLASCSRPPAPSSPVASGELTNRSVEAGATSGEAAPAFVGNLAMQYVRYLVEEIGPRPAGSAALARAGDYVIATLEGAGYEVQRPNYRLPGGPEVANITAVKAGRSKEEVVLAAHLDTVPDSPGANDDASGVAALLELAALLTGQEPPRSVRFLFLTAEEEIEGFEGHGYSSLQFFAGLAPDQVQNLAAACWMDKIAAGPTFKVLHTNEASASLARRLQEQAESRGMKPQLIAAQRWSKKMAFEDHGIPTAWIEYGPAPQLHQPGDDLTNVEPKKLKAVGDLVYRWITEGGEKP